jgi:hypothetical protein
VIEDGHAAVHKTIFRNSIQGEHIEELTFVGPDAANVRFCSVLTGSEQSPNEPIRSRKFLVVTRRRGVWKVSWGQNTRLRAVILLPTVGSGLLDSAGTPNRRRA